MLGCAGEGRPGEAAADITSLHQGAGEGGAQQTRGQALAPHWLGPNPAGPQDVSAQALLSWQILPAFTLLWTSGEGPAMPA